MANTHEVLQGVKDYTLELLGEEYRDVAVDAADRAEAQAERAEAAADNAEVGIRDDTVAKNHLTSGLRSEIDGKADKSYVDELVAPDGNHGNLISDVITLTGDDIVVDFPDPISGPVKVTLNIMSNVSGNQALVGYKFRGPNGEKALEGMGGLTYSTVVGEPYRYIYTGVDQVGVARNWAYDAVPDEGWTLDGLVLRAWNRGSGNVFINGVYTDVGTPPKVVTRDLHNGIAVPLVPTSRSSATAKGYVDDEVGKKADKDHTHTSAEITDATESSEGAASARKLVRWGGSGSIATDVDPTSVSHLTRKGYVDAEVGKKADKGHTHTAAQVGARPDTWTPTAEEVGARPDTWMPTASDVGAREASWTPTAQDVGARPADWVPTAAQVGARPDTWTPTAQEVGAATPGYVDSRIQLVTSWPASPVAGVLYLMEEG